MLGSGERAASQEASNLVRLICKVFHSACYMGVPDLLLQPDPFMGWMDCLKRTCLLPEPQVWPSAQSDDWLR